MQISVDIKLKHQNSFKVVKLPKSSSLFQRSRGIQLPNVDGLEDVSERFIDELHRTNVELNSEAYDYYSKLASESNESTETEDSSE